MSQELVAQLRAYGQDPNVRHFLDVVIPGAEGTAMHGYNTAFGGSRLDSLDDHPRYLKPFKQTDGKENVTSAAGKYQFLSSTWDDAAKNLGLKDFGPENQDLAAIYLLQQANAIPDLLRGDLNSAVNKTGKIWASLPSSPYPQPKQSQEYINALIQGKTMNPSQQSGSALPNALGMYTGTDPMAIYQMLQAQQKNIPVQQLTPEQKEALMGDRQQRASMLPLAIGASLAGDKRVAEMGSALTKDSMAARGPQQLGDEGWLTADGQLIENPFTSSKRDETRGDRLLQLAISAANQSTNAQMLNLLRAQQIQQATTKNAPAAQIPGDDGKPIIDENAPWKNLNNEQAGPLRASTLTSAQKQLADLREATQGDASSIQMMDQFLNLNQREPTGGFWDKYGPDKLKFGDTAAMLALQNKMTPLQRPAGSGATSDFEQKMYALGIPNVSNEYNVNMQTRLANAALAEARAERLKFYEQYLAKYGHLNGAESAFAPKIQEIEKKYKPQIDALSPQPKKKGSALPQVQPSAQPGGSGSLTPDEQRELEELRKWQAGGK